MDLVKKYYFFIAFFCLSTIISSLLGCSYSSTSSNPLAHSWDDIWDTSYRVIAHKYDIIRALREQGTIETDWKYDLNMMYLRGHRHKVHLEIKEYIPTKDIEEQEEMKRVLQDKPDIKDEKRYAIKIQVTKEVNRDVNNPESLQEALWFPEGNDIEREQFLINLITTKLNLNKLIKNPLDNPISSDKP